MAVPMPVAPLFEMKKDLEKAGDVLRGELPAPRLCSLP